ncbi:MAG: LamG domain-containing protein, partial [Paramuribaculum sp.]|nr:LamG domain-containing protein [Paramuribaculum sp.]
MKKLSLLLAGAMMVPAIGGAANQAVTVTHGTTKVKTSQRIEISDGILADGSAKNGKDFTMSTWVKVSNYDMAYASNNSVSSGTPSTGMIMGHRARYHDNTNGTFWVGYGTDGTLHLSGKLADTARFNSESKIEIDEWTYMTLTYNQCAW